MWKILLDRLKEPSTAAGIGILWSAVPELIATGGASPMAWGQVVAGVVAIAKKEGGKGA